MLMGVLTRFRAGLLLATVLVPCSFAEVAFPGPQPGRAKGGHSRGVFTLENSVISGSWRVSGGRLKPAQWTNRLTGQRFEQATNELFRVGLTPPKQARGVWIGLKLEEGRVVALASGDGTAWTPVASYPRSGFSGEPTLVRIGKMNLRAQAKDNPGDLGASGSCLISDFSLAKGPSIPSAFELHVKAHEASTNEFRFPSGTTFVSCRVDKGTDQGMSWGPGLAFVWQDGKKFLLLGVRDAKPVLNVTTAGGERILDASLANTPRFDLAASNFKIVGMPKIGELTGVTKGGRVADRIGGTTIEANLASQTGIRAIWRAELRDGSNYIRQTVAFSSPNKAVPIYGLELADVSLPNAQTIGTTPGCPVAGSGMFVGVEMPGAQNLVTEKRAKISFACQLELSPSQSYAFGAVTGVAPEGQLRRSFLAYVERERARPSSPFLHYNCWYDLGYTVDSGNFLDAIGSFTRELVQKRGVPVKSFLVDDGWDDPAKGLWSESTEKFPGGFAALKAKMEPMAAHLGVWISPMGGYGGDTERTADAQKMGIIPPGAKLDLSYPGYKKWFQDRCLQLMREDGVNAFKWDRAGDGVSPHFMALLDIARNLRKQNPDVFINVTVGTWPSPFWLNHVDSTWRMGSADVGWAGVGDMREKWITFRDGYCRRMFVEKSPLYPLNSVMHHGIVNGRYFQGEPIGKTGPHLKNEARSYFANGTSLQELYLTPSFMTAEAWDQVAEAAKWAHANADVLADSHWVGGDPLSLQVYGYAAWSPRKGTLMLRNPDDKPNEITVDIAKAFELPVGASRRFWLKSPYRDQRIGELKLTSGQPQKISLEPFEVLVFDATGF